MVGFEPRWGRCRLDGEGTVSAGRRKAQQSGGSRQGRVLGWNSGSFLRADCPMPPRFVPVVQWGTHNPDRLQSWETGSGSACPMTHHEQRWGPSQPPLSPSSKPSSESRLRPGLMGHRLATEAWIYGLKSILCACQPPMPPSLPWGLESCRDPGPPAFPPPLLPLSPLFT